MLNVIELTTFFLYNNFFVSREVAEWEEMHKREAEDQKNKEEEEERKLEQERLRVGHTFLPLSHVCTLT